MFGKRDLAARGLAVLVVACGAIAGGNAAAGSPPPAGTCVALEGVPATEPSAGAWHPRYVATNACAESVVIHWRHNTGEESAALECSAVLTVTLEPGAGGELEAGPLPPGVASHVAWCVEYEDAGKQIGSGHLGCASAGIPVCPPLR